LLPLKIGHVNGREAQEGRLLLKASVAPKAAAPEREEQFGIDP
jgi:hypothetical protein